MAKNEAKIKFNADVKDFNDSIGQANREMAELRAEMKLNETQMKGTEDSAEGLKKKHDLLERQLKASEGKTEALNQKLKKAEEIFGENSQEASKLRIQLLNAKNAEEKLKQAVNDSTGELKEQKNAAKGAGEGFTVMKGAVADLVSAGIQWGIDKLGEFTNYLASLPAETMEFRQDIATLTTSFDDMGFSTKTAKDTWTDLYAIFGEDDRAVEASNLIAKMAKDQQDLDDWTTITTGAWARFQDSLPVEGLAEASMEVSKTGKLTGVLVDALVWAGESEEGFQKKLDKCTNEQERQKLITETLMGLYEESAETYRDTAGGQMEAKEASAKLMQTEADLAETIEPVTTEFTNLKTELLEGAKPAIEKVTDIALDALEWMEEHPTATQAIVSAVGVLAIGLTGLAIALGIYAAAQWAANLAIAPFALPVLAAVAVIALLVGAGVALYKNWDKVKAKAKELWKNVTEKFNEAKTKITGIIEKIKTGISTRFDKIKSGAIEKFNAVKNGIINPIQNAKEKITSTVDGLKSNVTNRFKALKHNVITPIKEAKEKIVGFVDKIKGAFDFDWSIPKPKIPKFTVSGGKAPWGFGGKGKLPSVDVKWNALGAVVTKPTLVGAVGDTLMGAGEAGAEAILPISVLQDYINRAFDRNVYAYAAAGGNSDVYNFYVNDATINDNAQMRNVAKDFITELVRLGGMNR